MGVTAAGLRYPEPTDRVADGATAMLNLAADVTALDRVRVVKLNSNIVEVTTPTTAGSYVDALNLDGAMPASAPAHPTITPGRLLIVASFEGMWTGGAGGPAYRWLLNGAVAGQPRTLYSGQNSYQALTIFDYLTAPAAGASYTLRLQVASGSTIVCRSRNHLGLVATIA